MLQRPVQGINASFAPTVHYDTVANLAEGILAGKDHLLLAGEVVPLSSRSVRKRFQVEVSQHLYHPQYIKALAYRVRRYFPVIKPILKQYGIPSDMRYVLVHESMGRATAVSHRGATGLWQMMEAPARQMGLRIDNEVDERLDVEKSTHAAARWLKMLYKETGSWSNALAAYNRGLGGFQRASARQNNGNYYTMNMNRETCRYVYKVLALKELMENPDDYGLELPRGRAGWPDSRRLRVKQPITDMKAFAAAHNTDVASIRALNPWIIGNSLTPQEGKSYLVLIPKETMQLASLEREEAEIASEAPAMPAFNPEAIIIAADTLHDMELKAIK